MLEYEQWGNPSQLILGSSGDDPPAVVSHHGVEIFNANASSNNPNSHHSALSLDYAQAAAEAAEASHHHHQNAAFATFSQHQFFSADHPAASLHSLYDSRAFQTSYTPQHHHFEAGINSAAAGGGYFLVPKTEEGAAGRQQGARIGLNLGHRTYFSAQDEDFVSLLYRRSRPGGGLDGGGVSVNAPRCQTEGCAADLSNAKHYHRRHKVCEFHSKAATVIAGGLTQRFCQQCSRFHLLTEFDNGKRSCRRRLAEHNRRRRKTPQQPLSQPQLQKSPMHNSSETLAKSPAESSAMTLPSSSVTVAISPPRMTLESFRQRSHRGMASSSSSSSVFYSN